MRRQLSGTREIAAATSDTLKQQGEQIEQTTRDLDRMNHELKQADRNLSQLGELAHLRGQEQAERSEGGVAGAGAF